MNITSIGDLSGLSKYATGSAASAKENRNAAFDSLLEAAMGLVKEANSYTNAAEEAEMSYALGLTDNIHDLMIAQHKANLAIQYTVAVRNQVLDAYKEIMNLQF